MKRQCGMLLPVSSLPSPYGIGSFSREAYEFVDMLHEAGQKLWQILPLGPTGYGDSPYQSFSTFAGNPYFIDLEALTEEGLLTKEECSSYDWGDSEERESISYDKIYQGRFEILKQAFERYSDDGTLVEFYEENRFWLKDYALYMALKDSMGGLCWTDWDEDVRLRDETALAKYETELEGEIRFYVFIQYLFRKQWLALKKYANEKDVKIIGDIPIYVSFDSVDVWANPKLFQLDRKSVV